MNRKTRLFFKRNDEILCAMLALVAIMMFVIPAIIVVVLA